MWIPRTKSLAVAAINSHRAMESMYATREERMRLGNSKRPAARALGERRKHQREAARLEALLPSLPAE